RPSRPSVASERPSRAGRRRGGRRRRRPRVRVEGWTRGFLLRGSLPQPSFVWYFFLAFSCDRRLSSAPAGPEIPSGGRVGTTTLKTVTPIDFVVIGLYMILMLGIGFYAMRFNRGAADYFKGGNRVHWLAAGLSSFMSGFSAWTFTGAAGLAYQHGLVTVLLYVGNACTFLLGYFVFAVRWRRARISTVMEYLVDRFDERTRQTFSWSTTFLHLFTRA